MKLRLDYVRNFCDIQSCLQDRTLIEADFIWGLSSFLGKHGVDANTAHSIARAMFFIMQNKNLHYHTPVHILAMFQFAKSLEDRPLEPWEELTIWFHDVIYYPGRDDNEFASARLMESLLAGTPLNKNYLKESIAAIKTTSKHLVDWIEPKHAFIMDLDLASFAFPYKSYEVCSKCIRKEFSTLSDLDYQKGRIDFLTKLLKSREKIYRTPAFAYFEKEAQKRIKCAIECLSMNLTKDRDVCKS